MLNKNEIDLKNIPETGETFEFSADDILSLDAFNEIILNDDENLISLKVTPIGDDHYEVKASLKITSLLSCVNCGEDTKGWFEDDVKEYLSLNNNEEGEDQGFLLIDSPRWNWPQFIIDSVELEKPYRNYKCPKACLKTATDYNKESEKAWEDGDTAKTNAFSDALSSLEGFKAKLK